MFQIFLIGAKYPKLPNPKSSLILDQLHRPSFHMITCSIFTLLNFVTVTVKLRY